MALVLNFDVPATSNYLLQTNNCKQFNFYDTTGAYNASTNPIGWGTPNTALNDLNYARATILPYLSTAAPFVVEMLNDVIPFPNTGGFPFTILNTSLGLSSTTPIPSQICSLAYSVQDAESNVIYTTTKWIYLDCSHTCCADQLSAKLLAMNCGCDGGSAETQKEYKDLLFLWTRMNFTIQAIRKSLNPDCLKLTEAQNNVVWLNAICAKMGNCGDC